MLRNCKIHQLTKSLALVLLIASGCREVVQDKIQNTDQYFDLRGLLEEQIILLDSLRPAITKTTNIDGVEETQAIQLDSTGWATELQIFFEADINDPILRDAYQLKEETQGDSMRSESFEVKTGQNTEIKILKIDYPSETNAPAQISAVFEEKNALYDAKRALELRFERYDGENILTGYSIIGAQKMLLKDTVFYKVQVENNFQ